MSCYSLQALAMYINEDFKPLLFGCFTLCPTKTSKYKCSIIFKRIKRKLADDKVNAIRCREANILPLQLHFELNDLVFFYKIVYDLIPVSLPAYISPYNGESRLRSTRMDEMSYAVNDNTVIPLDTAHRNSKFFKSFFYRTMHSWNSLPLDISISCTLVKFKLEVKNFLWNKLLSNNSLEMG